MFLVVVGKTNNCKVFPRNITCANANYNFNFSFVDGGIVIYILNFYD